MIDADHTPDTANLSEVAAGKPVEDAKLPMSGVDSDGRPWRRVPLERPLDRHGNKYKHIVVRKPYGTDCSGASLGALHNGDVSHLAVVLPRVTEPALSKHEFLAMGIDDIAELSGAIIHFLLTTPQKASLGLTD
ncbi:MAG: phage tail assembly protein [Caulobacteraceae bacterium]|nr:MAG: phage tail assembly protein [Caulobacteraceae bacterium]